MDVLTKEQRHKCMKNVKSVNTKPEVLLRKALWHDGIRYRKNYKKLPGTPDIAITKRKIAIFGMHEIIRIIPENKLSRIRIFGYSSWQEM